MDSTFMVWWRNGSKDTGSPGDWSFLHWTGQRRLQWQTPSGDMQKPPRGEWSDNWCVMRDLVIVSCPTTPISVEALVSEPKCPSLNLKGNNPYSLMLPFGLFMQHRLRPIQCSLHLLYVVQDSGGSKWSLSLGGCGLGKTLIWWLVIWYSGKFHWSNNTHNLTTPTNSKPLSLIATVSV